MCRALITHAIEVGKMGYSVGFVASVGSRSYVGRKVEIHERKGGCRVTGRRERRVLMNSHWFEASAEQEIEAPKDYVYEQYSNLEQMPQWAPWLESVTVEDEAKGISRWRIGSRGFRFSWRARNTQVIPGELIAWESIDGLKNKGAVQFSTDDNKNTVLQMSIAFKLPDWLLRIFGNSYVRNFVSEKLRSELQTFRSIMLQKRRDETVRAPAKKSLEESPPTSELSNRTDCLSQIA